MAIDSIDKMLNENNDILTQTFGELPLDMSEPEADITILIGEDGEMEEELPEPEPEFGDNLAEFMTEEELSSLANDMVEAVQDDMDSRKDWVAMYVKGLKILGINGDEVSEPWEGASAVFSNILSEAAIRFQAETMIETFPAAGPVKTKIIGEKNKDTDKAAARVKEDMNNLLLEEMVEYRSEHERLLFTLGLAGSAFKKTYFDPNLQRPVACFYSPEEVVVGYGATHINTAERITHIMRKSPNEVKKLQNVGFYKDVELPDPEPFHTDVEEEKNKIEGYTLNEDNRHTLFEIHCEFALSDYVEEMEEDDEILPYVVTVDKSSNEVLAIYRNWREDDELKRKRNHFVHYVYVPGFGFYGLGLIHIIGGYAEAGTQLIRQLIDAGTLANLPGGFKTKEFRTEGDDMSHAPGQWKDVDIASGTLKDNLVPLPYKEPSPTLMALLEKITDDGRRLAAVADIEISDMGANSPVGTTLALLERTLKPMSAIQGRVHYAMKQEFQQLKEIVAENMPMYPYTPMQGQPLSRAEDYSVVEIIPVSDPNSSTMAQRVTQYQAVLQMSQQAPHIYDMPQLHRKMIDTLGIKEAAEIIPVSEDAEPKDPVSENMDALNGVPMKAFIYQDHDAHIATHISMLQNPQIMQGIGQNPRAQGIMASLQAHIAEHIAYKYRKDVEDKLGAQLPPPGERLPEEIEVNLSRLVADASQMLSGQRQKEAAQAQAQQQMQDPQIQLQQADQQRKMKETEIKEREQKRKEFETAHEIDMDKKELALDKAELAMKALSSARGGNTDGRG